MNLLYSYSSRSQCFSAIDGSAMVGVEYRIAGCVLSKPCLEGEMDVTYERQLIDRKCPGS